MVDINRTIEDDADDDGDGILSDIHVDATRTAPGGSEGITRFRYVSPSTAVGVEEAPDGESDSSSDGGRRGVRDARKRPRRRAARPEAATTLTIVHGLATPLELVGLQVV
jgi:hypothetical protein